jgi:hypothetical protein
VLLYLLVARTPCIRRRFQLLSEETPYLFAMKNITPLLVSSAAYIAAVNAGSPSPESGYHYTPAWSPWAPVTVYATITESTTIYTPLPTTVYVTLSSTTSTTTKPVTATEVIEEIITSKVEQATITLCTSRDINPTYTAAIIPLPSDYTWGCPPGYLCKPKQENCNFEVGLPSESYYCAPDECIPVTPLPAPQLWNPTVYGNSSPATDPSLKYDVVDHYFNMNPRDYGLSYDIFVATEVITYTYTTTIIEAPTPAVRARQAQTSVPAACYPWCNNCLLEAQAVGKSPALCVPGSAFEVDMNDCQQCIAYHRSDSTGTFVQIAPQFQQFINYCAQVSSTTVVSTATSTYTSTPIPIVQTSSSKTLTTLLPPSTSKSTYLTSSTVVINPSSTNAPPATFSGSAVPTIRPSGVWTSFFSVIGSMLACVFWI